MPSPANQRRTDRRILLSMLVLYAFALLVLIVAQPAKAAPVSEAGQALIVKFEVGGRDAYDKRYQWPICPACSTTASGVTVGIGYDLRHQSATAIRTDWAGTPFVDRFVAAQGLGGTDAIIRARQMRDIRVSYPLANAVFKQATLPKYDAIARRSFGAAAYDRAPQAVRDALVSVVYNRGGSTVGPARAEFRVIRDQCLPAGRIVCTADQIRSMTRIWRGTAIEAGMTRRRYAEAAHAER